MRGKGHQSHLLPPAKGSSITSSSDRQVYTVHVRARIRGGGSLINTGKNYKISVSFTQQMEHLFLELIKVDFIPVQTKELRAGKLM